MRSFALGHARLGPELRAAAAALRRATIARRRAELARPRADKRGWVVKRGERTRQLIELGGLVTKSGLVELTDDDRAVIYGALLAVAGTLRGEDREQSLLLWGRRGHRAFEAGALSRDADRNEPC